MILVYITNPTEAEARQIARQLLEKKLIACANIFPVNSMYWWKGKIANDRENVIIAKTSDKNFKKLENEVKKIHSYEIQCILRISATANKEYEAWANKEIK